MADSLGRSMATVSIWRSLLSVRGADVITGVRGAAKMPMNTGGVGVAGVGLPKLIPQNPKNLLISSNTIRFFR